MNNYEIISFKKNKNGTKDSSFKPQCVKRLSDDETFSIGDEVKNHLSMQGFIKDFSLLEDEIYVSHTWSGVEMSLNSLEKVKKLPSKFQINQVVKLSFIKDSQYATIRAIHFFNNNIKYDLSLWLGDGSVDNPESESRIYNVEEKLLVKV